MSAKHLIIAFEGCSLSGKTTLIQALRDRYDSVVNTEVILEYTQWVGGAEKLPRMGSPHRLYPPEREMAFMSIERERVSAIAAITATEAPTLILVDRTLLACIELRDRLLGARTVGLLEQAVDNGIYIEPQYLVLLGVSAEQHAVRLRERVPFYGSQFVFQNVDRDVFARYARLLLRRSRIVLYPEHARALEDAISGFVSAL